MVTQTMDEQFLRAALQQAWKGRGICAPNPSVGAVAVQNNSIIAQAWHHGAGSAHAEQLLLSQLPPGLPGITLYVTLEPCNHWGRTPPCVDAIRQYGIERVVYGYSDPNPMVIANNTPKILQDGGIEVLHVILPEINEFYRSYAYWTQTKKPWVTVKLAQTLDGKIAGLSGERLHLSNELCFEFTHEMRRQTDVILTTAQTVNCDDPALNVRLSSGTTSKPVAVIDARASLNPASKLFKTAKYCHIYHLESVKIMAKQPNCTYHGMPGQDGRVDLEAVIHHLGHLGYHDLWVEAGGTLFSALHQAGLVQRTYLYLVPRFLGRESVSVYPHQLPWAFSGEKTWIPKGDNMILSICSDPMTGAQTCLPV